MDAASLEELKAWLFWNSKNIPSSIVNGFSDLLAQAEPKAPLTMREQAQLDNYGYEKEDIEKGEMTAGQEKLCRDLDKVIDILEEKPAPSATEEERREMLEWIDLEISLVRENIAEYGGEGGNSDDLEIWLKVRALIAGKPRVKVTRESVRHLVMTLDPTKSYDIELYDHNLHARTEAIVAWLREKGVEIEEKP